MTEPTQIPADFLWGAAAAAYQIEGAATEDGRGESIWDRFSATPGKVRNGESGAVACDFYHRFSDDIGLMEELGIDAFRFSVSWPRILPEGRGRVNPAGLDFYDRLVDELLERGIEPFLTLYHWDLPQALEDEGGWRERSTAEAFVDYAAVVAERLGDRVRNWMTHNEPWVVSWVGHAMGKHAPGLRSEAAAVAVSHHLLLSHGLAVPVINAAAPDARVGIVLDLWQVYPASDSPEDAAAALRVDAEHNRWFLDPLFRGEYPAELPERNEIVAPLVRDGDLEAIAAPIDFLGVNNYSRALIAAGSDGPRHVRNPEAVYTEMDWEVFPEGLRALLVRVATDYNPAELYVTENGASFGDVLGHDGHVHDPERTEYLTGYLDAVAGAIAEGAPVKGYFVWSLLDNFEWAFGYSKRFGIVYVDYPTLDRIPKDSFFWYRDHISRSRTTRGPSPAAPVTAG
jgi:beta-glucosidase